MTVAVVGTGSAGRRHLANLRQLDREVVAVSASRPPGSFDLDGSPVPCVPELTAAIERGLDAVVVANPTSLHEAVALEALAAGLDVYLEKPATTTAPTCESLLLAAERADAVVAVGHQLRFHPLIDALDEVLASGRLGRLVSIHADWVEHLADYHPEEDYRTGYAAHRELGGGVLLTQIHLPDLLHHLVGPFRSVLAVGGQLSHLELDVEDAVTFLATSADEVAVGGHLDYLQRPKRSTIQVTGTRGRASADLISGELLIAPADPAGPTERIDLAIDRNELFLAAMRDFLDACERRRPPRCGLPDAVAVLRFTDAVRTSMTEGREVVLARS